MVVAGHDLATTKTNGDINDHLTPLIVNCTCTVIHFRVITTEALRATDGGAQPDDLVFTVTTPPQLGYVGSVVEKNTPVTSFTQARDLCNFGYTRFPQNESQKRNSPCSIGNSI